MNRMLRWALPERSDEAVADLLDLFERRAAKVGRTRARVRLALDFFSLMAFGARRRSRPVVAAFPRSASQLLIGLPGDFRSATRALRKSPSFSLAAVVILALGIGANTAIFSLVNAILLTPIPAGEPEIVGVYSRETDRPGEYRIFSYADYENIRAARAPFADVMAYSVVRVGVTERDDTRMQMAVVATSNYFSLLDTRLVLGREFTADEQRPASDIRVVIASYRHWQRKGGTGAVLGTTVRLNGLDYTIVGVAPDRFTGTMAMLAPEFFLPTGVFDRLDDDIFREREQRLADPATRSLMLVGRLPDGLSTEEAGPTLSNLSAHLAAIDPAANGKHALVIQKLPRMAISTNPATDQAPTVLSAMLMGTASLVLLLACLNLANMLLARGTARRREIAVRVAVGGGRLRIVRQLLVESLMLALLGGGVGLLLASSAMGLFMDSLHAVLPVILDFDGSLDIRVLMATLVFCVLSTVAAGLGPAWRASRPDLLTDLKDQPATAVGLRRLSVRNTLVVAQVAVCLALLVTAGLFVRSAFLAVDANPGFSTDRGILLGVNPGLAGYSASQGRATMDRLMQRLRAIPGVETASFGSIVPFGDEHDGRPVLRVGAADGTATTSATFTVVGADYFKALGVSILQGREFSASEESAGDGAAVAVIDQALATRLFGAEDPIGQPIRFAREEESARSLLVVGVAGGVRHAITDVVPRPHIYVPYGQRYVSGQNIHIRVREGVQPDALLGVVRQITANVDPALPVLRLKTLEQFRRGSLQIWIFTAGAQIFSAFGIVALILAVVGVYGMKAYVVSRRTREIAIRLALGATPREVVWMIVSEGLKLTSVGLVAGIALALGIGQALSALLMGVSPTDPAVFGGAIGVLTLAALVASYIPARRATKLTPTAALRAD